MRPVARWVPFVLLLAVVAAPARVDAQRQRDPAPDRAQIEQRIRAQMARMMQERLGLDQQEAASLSEIVQRFDSQRRELGRREQDTRRRVDSLTASGGGDDEARELLLLQSQLRLEEAQLFRAEQDALLGVLSPRQVLELQELREDLGRRIRALRGGGRDGANGGPRGPGPRPDGRIGERRDPPDRPGPS